MKLLTYLIELDDHPKHGWSQRPVGLVFSKADECEECFDDPVAYAKAHSAGLVAALQRAVQSHFGSSPPASPEAARIATCPKVACEFRCGSSRGESSSHSSG